MEPRDPGRSRPDGEARAPAQRSAEGARSQGGGDETGRPLRFGGQD